MVGPTHIHSVLIEWNNLAREGLRLVLAQTAFSPRASVPTLSDPSVVDDAALVIFGVRDRESSADLIRIVLERCPAAKIVAIANESQRGCLASAFEFGAHAALFTTITPEGLVNALHAVVSSEVLVIDASTRHDIPSSLGAHRELPPPPGKLDALAGRETRSLDLVRLSEREVAILIWIVRGESNKHIARRFDISEATVKAHMKAILRKIGAQNRTQAAIWALSHGIVEPNVGIVEPDGFDRVAVPFDLGEHAGRQ